MFIFMSLSVCKPTTAHRDLVHTERERDIFKEVLYQNQLNSTASTELLKMNVKMWIIFTEMLNKIPEEFLSKY